MNVPADDECDEHDALTAEVARLYAYIASIEAQWCEDQKRMARAEKRVELMRERLRKEGVEDVDVQD